MGVIKQLKKLLTGEQIFPITKFKAIYDDSLGRLDQALGNNFPYMTDDGELSESDVNRDADTLSGYLPSYFAKSVDMVQAFANMSDKYTRKAYNVGDYCIYLNVLYRCIVDIPDEETFNEEHWVATNFSSEIIRTASELLATIESSASSIESSLGSAGSYDILMGAQSVSANSSSATKAITFEKEFEEAPLVLVTSSNNTFSYCTARKTTGCTLAIWSAASVVTTVSAVSGTVTWVALGKFKEV